MDLKGNLEIFEPISVFQLVNLCQATGELELSVVSNKAKIFFKDGGVVYAEIKNRPVKLGEHLVRQKLITADDLIQVLKRKHSSKRLGAALIEDGLLTEDTLRTAIETQIKEVIYEVVKWRTGTFTFTRNRRPEAQDVLINIPLDHLVLEGLKRMDEEGDGAQ